MKPFRDILLEFYAFALGRLVPMLAAWPFWSLRARRRPVRRGRLGRNPTAKP